MTRAPALGLLGTVGVGPAEMGELAKAAETAGWDGVWMVEFEYDTFAFDQVIAANTSRVLTGSCIARAFARHPLLVAETATVIDLLAPGRFVIGLGNGGVSERSGDRAWLRSVAPQEADPASLQRWGMDAAAPVARMREYVEVIRLALAGDELDYAGRFYRFAGFRPSLTPTGTIPVYLGARQPGMLALAGEIADGVFLWLVGEGTTRDAIAIVSDAARRSGRDISDLTVGCLVPTCAHRERDRARRAMRRYLVDYYLGRGVYANVLADIGFEFVAEQVRALVAAGSIDRAADAIPDEALDELALAGAPHECTSRLADWHARGLDYLMLYVFPADDDWPAAYRSVIREMAPGA